MAHQIDWLCKKRVIGCYLNGIVTIDDIHSGYAKMRELIVHGNGGVHLVVDHRYVEQYDLSLRQMQNALRLSLVDNVQKAVVIIPNPRVHQFSSIVTGTMRRSLCMVDTQEKALAILCDADATLATPTNTWQWEGAFGD